MSQYKTGAVSVTNGSQVVTGTGTLWLSNVSPGDGFTVAGTGVPYTVGSVDSDEQMTLNANYAGPSGAGLAYTIWRDFEANTGAPEMSQGDIETATIFTRAIRALGQRLGLATTAVAGIVEKATSSEARSAAVDKFPDAAGVHEALKRFGITEELEFLGNIDLNTLSATGFYYVGGGSGAANLPATGTTFVQVLSSADGSDRAFQLAKTVANNSPLYFRSSFDGLWSRWFTIFSHNSILGTVSQSGGSPTGAIIERGSNANGEYVKLADGTLVCLKTNVQLVHASSDRMDVGWTYPSVFSAPPLVHFSPDSNGSNWTNASNRSEAYNASNTGSGLDFTTLRAWFQNDVVDPADVINNCMALAIGRWF